MIALLSDKDWTVRLEAVNILKETGGAKSLALLKTTATADENGSVKITAASALKEIENRAGGK